jgi:phospholipid transport system substrate-binding protein
LRLYDAVGVERKSRFAGHSIELCAIVYTGKKSELMNRTLIAILIVCTAMIVGSARAAAPVGTPSNAAAAGQSADPVAVIKRLQATLIQTMKDGQKLGFQGRYKRLEPVVVQTHDFAFIARLVLGSDGAKLSTDQQNQFVKAFTQLGVSTYAKEFNSYSGEHFDQGGTQANAGSTVVYSTLVIADHDPVKFEYQMHRVGANWMIVNIIADGVSDLALKRTQYRELLRQKGFSGLLAWITEQTQKNSQESSG